MWEPPKAGVDISSQQRLFQRLRNPADPKVLPGLQVRRGHGLWPRSAEGGGLQRALGSGAARREDGSCGARVSLRWAPSPFPLPRGRRAARSHHLPTGVLMG